MTQKTDKKKLTTKQQLFVQEYIVDFNATQAAIRAGYSKKSASVIAAQNLAKLYISEAIAEAMEGRILRTKVDADYVLHKAVQYLETSMKDFLVVPEDGGMPYFDLSQATPEQLAAIDTLQLDTVKERDGVDEDGKPATVTVRKIRLSIPKRKEMLELIGKHVNVQAFREQVGIGNPDGSNIDKNWVVEVVPGKPKPVDP